MSARNALATAALFLSAGALAAQGTPVKPKTTAKADDGRRDHRRDHRQACSDGRQGRRLDRRHEEGDGLEQEARRRQEAQADQLDVAGGPPS